MVAHGAPPGGPSPAPGWRYGHAAFFNDTGLRYNEQAAREAYAAVLDWFGRYLV
jgi:dienelactone hydrolase